MSLGRYAVLVLVLVAATLGLVGPLFRNSLGRLGLVAAVVGGGLATANTLAAYALIVWSEGRPTKAFLGAVLGGMLGRMALMLAAVAACVLYFDLPQVPLTVSLLGYFVFFLILELAVVQRKPANVPERQ